MPGHAFPGDPEAFATRDEVVRFLDSYASTIQAPLRCGVRVTALRAKPGTERLVVESDDATLEAVNVVVATGPFQEPVVPPFAASLPPEVVQVTSNDIRTRPNSRPALSWSWDPRPPAARSLRTSKEPAVVCTCRWGATVGWCVAIGGVTVRPGDTRRRWR